MRLITARPYFSAPRTDARGSHVETLIAWSPMSLEDQAITFSRRFGTTRLTAANTMSWFGPAGRGPGGVERSARYGGVALDRAG